MKRPKVSIIILNWNKLEYTKNCIASIEQNTSYPDYEIILFDNGSTEPGTEEFLSALKHKVIRSPHNLGFAKGNNKAVDAADGDLLLFLNNDTITHKSWLEEMIKTLHEYPECGIVGSKLLYPDGTIQHIGVVLGRKGNGYHPYKGCPADIPPAMATHECEAVTGACLLISKDVFGHVGGFDERYLHGSEDADICLKVRRLGLKVLYCPGSVLTHFEQVSFKEKSSSDRKRSTRRNERLFCKKWAAAIDDMRLPNDYTRLGPHHYSEKAMRKVAKLVPEDSSFILDIYCGGGLLGRLLKEQASGRIVWGIEKNKDAAIGAEQNLDRLIIKDIEAAGRILNSRELFDCIICADVFEHIKDPASMPALLLDHLKPEGFIVCSFANKRYYKTVKREIIERWHCGAGWHKGTSHLKPFSFSIIKDMFSASGCRIVSIERDIKGGWLLSRLNKLLFNMLEDRITREYIVVFKRGDDARVS